MNTSYLDDSGGFSVTRASGMQATAHRWCEYDRPGVYGCSTEKNVTDEGKPAKLCRRFDCVVDDFGTLVEVPA